MDYIELTTIDQLNPRKIESIIFDAMNDCNILAIGVSRQNYSIKYKDSKLAKANFKKLKKAMAA